MSPPCATTQPSLPRPAECPARTRNCSKSEQEAASCGFAPTPKSGLANCRGGRGGLQNLAGARKPSEELGSFPHLQPPLPGRLEGPAIQMSRRREGCFMQGRQRSGAGGPAGSRAAAQASEGWFMHERAGILQWRAPCSRSASHSCWARLRYVSELVPPPGARLSRSAAQLSGPARAWTDSPSRCSRLLRLPGLPCQDRIPSHEPGAEEEVGGTQHRGSRTKATKQENQPWQEPWAAWMGGH